MNNPLYPWQNTAWQQFQALRGRMPHALLLHGPQGIGKADFAEYLAKSVLCENPQADHHACGQCPSCIWIGQMNHPDFRRVRPETLEEEGAAEAGEGGESEGGGKKSAKPKTPSKEIKIDQIRALADFMNIATHRQGLRVVVLYPAECLNLMASNALLKTLEEPPPATLFLLVTHRPDRLLPTILSRCRQFALHAPDHAAALAWLQQQGVPKAADWLAEQGGAPLLAKQMAELGERDEIDWFLQQLATPGVENALRMADKLQKTPASQLLLWLQRWLYDLLSCKLAGTIRYYPRQQKALAALAQGVDLARLLHVLKLINQRRAIVDHPLAPKLFIEDMLLDYSALYA
jgi:DNA polymerase-3 subunit delta'